MAEKIIRHFKDLDTLFPCIGIIVSSSLLMYSISFYRSIVLSYVSILLLLSCIFWLIIKDNLFLPLDLQQSCKMGFLTLILFTLLATASILSVHFRENLYERPLVYFIFTSLMICILSVEILFISNKFYPLILGQVILIGISITWSQTLIFPDLLGNDPYYHRMFTQQIIDSHFIPNGFSYSRLPLFHLYSGISSLILGANYKFATLLSVSLSHIICSALFIFLLTKRIFNNYLISCFAALLAIIANQHILMTYWPIPNSFATLFILIIIYLLSFQNRSNVVISKILVFFLSVCLILTHTIATMYMAIVVIIVYFANRFVNYYFYKHDKIQYSLAYIAFFCVFMISWWTYASGHIYPLVKLIEWGFNIEYFSSTPHKIITEITSNLSLFEIIFNSLGTLLFFVFSLIGCFYMTSKKYGNNISFTIVLVGLIPLVLSFITSISNRSILEMRWWYFAQLFLSIPLAVSFFAISGIYKKRSTQTFFILISTLCLSFILIMSPAANVDNPVFSPNTSMRTTLIASEIQSIKTISDIWITGAIKTDNYFARANSFTYDVEPFDEEIYSRNFNMFKGNPILIRNEIIQNQFQLYTSIYSLDYDLIEEFNSRRFIKVYDCGTVYAFL